MRTVPWYWRLTPFIHLLILAVLIGNGMLNAAPVEGYSAPPEVRRLPDTATCGSWQTWSGRTVANRGYPLGTQPWITVNWTVRRNNCSIIPLDTRCGAWTLLMSAKFEWCGSYRLSASRIVIGSNWQTCTTPIQGWGACWDGYVRQELRANGTKSYSWPHNPFDMWLNR